MKTPKSIMKKQDHKTNNTMVEKVQRAEIKMAAFVVEHHLPFEIMDHLSDLVTDIFLILKLLKRSKVSIQNVAALSNM